MGVGQTTHIYLNPVKADRADDFEAWMRSIVPAINRNLPDLKDRWHVLRATEEENGVRTYAFVFDGGDINEWEIEPVLEKALGADGARKAMDDWGEMMIGDQYGWSLEAVEFD
jgi:hypothetical protein